MANLLFCRMQVQCLAIQSGTLLIRIDYQLRVFTSQFFFFNLLILDLPPQLDNLCRRNDRFALFTCFLILLRHIRLQFIRQIMYIQNKFDFRRIIRSCLCRLDHKDFIRLDCAGNGQFINIFARICILQRFRGDLIRAFLEQTLKHTVIPIIRFIAINKADIFSLHTAERMIRHIGRTCDNALSAICRLQQIQFFVGNRTAGYIKPNFSLIHTGKQIIHCFT